MTLLKAISIFLLFLFWGSIVNIVSNSLDDIVGEDLRLVSSLDCAILDVLVDMRLVYLYGVILSIASRKSCDFHSMLRSRGVLQ